jgi:LysR family transcriptional regulator, cys regulon transcriptional activator
MTLEQLRHFVAIVDNGFSASAAADALQTTQPRISKTLALFEASLKLKLFDRRGKRLAKLTAEGSAVLANARRVLGEMHLIERVADQFSQSIGGTLVIATTHTQARYVLPQSIAPFLKRYPEVRLQLKQGTPTQCANWVAAGEADLAIATEALAMHTDLVTLDCYEWNRVLIAPKGHALARLKQVDLAMLATYPLITYDGTFTGRSAIDAAFKSAKVSPNVVLTALDSDVIKTYVGMGLGVGIIAEMAVSPSEASQFEVMSAKHLFKSSITRVGLRSGSNLRLTVTEFISHFSPKLTKKMILNAVAKDGILKS